MKHLLVSKIRGVTFIEVAVSLAVLAIMMTSFAISMRLLSKQVVQTNANVNGSLQGQKLFALIEHDLTNANAITLATDTTVQFILDYSQTPNYNPDGDLDGDGIPNKLDPDIDGDANQPLAWNTGYNLHDDDDDNDGKIDYQVRIWFSSGTLYRDGSINEEAWGRHISILATNVARLTFSYFGSKANKLGANLDLGHDGLPGTSDVGENDGIIDQYEIDMVGPANGGDGNRNGKLDTANEYRYITGIRIDLELNPNKNGQTNVKLSTEIYPPLLPLKPGSM